MSDSQTAGLTDPARVIPLPATISEQSRQAQRFGKVEEIAGLAVLLASPLSANDKCIAQATAQFQVVVLAAEAA